MTALRTNLSRRLARLAATQALYQMEVTSKDANEVVLEFEGHRLAKLPGVSDADETDKEYFTQIVRGVVGKQSELDKAISAHLMSGWSLDRLDSTLRAILRASAYEFAAERETPAKVVLNEYVDICHAFFGESERKFANAVMDAVARHVRPEEFAETKNGADSAPEMVSES